MSFKDQWRTSFLNRWLISIYQLICFVNLLRRNNRTLRRFHSSLQSGKSFPRKKGRFTLGHVRQGLKRILNEGSKVLLQKAFQDREILQQFYFDLVNSSTLPDERKRFLNSELAVSLQEDVAAWTFLRYLKVQLEDEQLKILSQHRRLAAIILDLLEFCGCNYALSDYGDVKRTLPIFLTKIGQRSFSASGQEQPVEAPGGHIPQSEKTERATVGILAEFFRLVRQPLDFRTQRLSNIHGLSKTQVDIENVLNQRLKVAGNKAFFNNLLYEAHLESLGFLLDLFEASNKNVTQDSNIDTEGRLSKAIAELENNRKAALNER